MLGRDVRETARLLSVQKHQQAQYLGGQGVLSDINSVSLHESRLSLPSEQSILVHVPGRRSCSPHLPRGKGQDVSI